MMKKVIVSVIAVATLAVLSVTSTVAEANPAGVCGPGYDYCGFGYVCVIDSNGIKGRCVKR